MQDIARIKRGVSNLAFQAEQDKELVHRELGALREQIEELQQRLEGSHSAAAPAQVAVAPDDSDQVRELRALRRQVAELHRTVAELRRANLASQPRRRFFGGSGGKGGKEGRAAAGSRSAARPSKRGGSRRQKRFWRRVARTPRRVRLRMLRLYRRFKAIVRQRLFARRLGSLNHHAPKELKIPRRYHREIKLADPPTISIVTPSYNQGHFLERTIRSVVDQDYPNIEYIVQDGGSTDDTSQVLEQHADRLFYYEMRKDEGQADAINLGFRHTSGDVMAYLNSDDVLLPGSLRYVARYFERHPEVDVVYGHRVLVDEDDMEIGRWVMPRHDDEVLSWADFVPQETMFWRRSIWEQSGAAMDKAWYLILDWDLILRFREAGANFKRLPRFLGGFRIHEVQKTSAVMDSHGKAEFAAIRERCNGHEVSREEVRKGVARYLRRHHMLQKMYRARLLRY